MSEKEKYENICMAQHYLQKLDPFSLMGVACQLFDITSAELKMDREDMVKNVYLGDGGKKAEAIQSSIECAKDFRSRDWLAESQRDIGGNYIC